MCEVTNKNFPKLYMEIKASFEKAKFFSVDLEFSALQPLKNNNPSLFDSNKDRYLKLKKNLEKVIPLQVGLTAFHFCPEENEYFGEVYNFYVFPATFAQLDMSFYFQASSIRFLCMHNFDFNKFAYLGVPYVNSIEEKSLKDKLINGCFNENSTTLNHEIFNTFCRNAEIIKKWYEKCEINDILEIADLKKYKNIKEISYFIHKKLRKHFNNLWTYESSDSFFVKKVTTEELEKLLKHNNLEENLIDDIIGFRKIFKLLTGQKKPIIGHNLMQDLMIMINTFELPLPTNYSHYKQLTNRLFPTIFDTKTLFYELRSEIPKDKLPEDSSLAGLFQYFKDGTGRHLYSKSPAINCNIPLKDFGRYHEAGWDSFCAGYIFLRLGYFNVAQNYPKSKRFVSKEIIGGLEKYKNCVNMIRGSTGYIKIDGEDPISTRPPWLVIESRKSVDESQVTSLLSSFGYFDVLKISRNGNQFLIAVDNFRTARQISNNFKCDANFKIKQYNTFRHNPIVKKFLIAALTISGGLLIWTVTKN